MPAQTCWCTNCVIEAFAGPIRAFAIAFFLQGSATEVIARVSQRARLVRSDESIALTIGA